MVLPSCTVGLGEGPRSHSKFCLKRILLFQSDLHFCSFSATSPGPAKVYHRHILDNLFCYCWHHMKSSVWVILRSNRDVEETAEYVCVWPWRAGGRNQRVRSQFKSHGICSNLKSLNLMVSSRECVQNYKSLVENWVQRHLTFKGWQRSKSMKKSEKRPMKRGEKRGAYDKPRE